MIIDVTKSYLVIAKAILELKVILQKLYSSINMIIDVTKSYLVIAKAILEL